MRKRILTVLVAVVLLTGVSVNLIGGNEPVFSDSEVDAASPSGNLATLGPVRLIDNVYGTDVAGGCSGGIAEFSDLNAFLETSHSSTASRATITNLFPGFVASINRVFSSGFQVLLVPFSEALCPPSGSLMARVEIPLNDGTYYADLVVG